MQAALTASGLGIVAFARKHKITPQRVIFWRGRCQAARVASTPGHATSPIRELKIADTPTAVPAIGGSSEAVIATLGALHFRVTRTTDPVAIEVLLRAIQRSRPALPC